MYKKFQLVVAVLCGSLAINITTTSIATASTLSNVLAKYCVPKDSSICSASSKATYNAQKNVCECQACGMFYNTASRKCEPCAVGTYVNNRYSTTCISPSCGAGRYPSITQNINSCAKGYYRIVLSTCS